MNDSATRMRVLIEDLLNFSRVSGENQFVDTVDLNELIDEVKKFIFSAIEDSKAEIIIEDLPILNAVNHGNLFMLFQNLLSNALKFSKDEIRPKVILSSSQISAIEAIKYDSNLNGYKNYHEIKVIDSGIGFEEQYLPKIFTIFQKLHGRSEYEGTGIGLAVCQKICKTHEGFITAQSKLGEGATFIIILPIK
jgi:signal transduction histidine kinase